MIKTAKVVGKVFSTSLGEKLQNCTYINKSNMLDCSRCDYQATQKSAVETHINALHEGNYV